MLRGQSDDDRDGLCCDEPGDFASDANPGPRRFQDAEKRLAERGKTPDQSDLAEMDSLWDEAKAAERG